MKIEKMSLKGIKNVLSRAEMKMIMAGSDGGGQCGNPVDGCLTSSCIAQSGLCAGQTGTCGSSSHGTACTCAAVC